MAGTEAATGALGYLAPKSLDRVRAENMRDCSLNASMDYLFIYNNDS